ncbi:MAG TPA: glycine cleavage system aminomethyltransferase GcvT [bacterium]|nr:glycine cleavage system aminomethyltransferase GcvT [bacterium]
MLITPLYESHKNLNAKFVDFYGWTMPLYYTGVIEEAKATRSNAGVFDISHMARFLITAPSIDFFDRLFTNDPRRLLPGKAHYTLLCREDGGILDDTVLSRLDDNHFLLIVNACNHRKILDWLKEHSTDEEINDVTGELSCIAIQGPRSREIVEKLLRVDLSGLKRFNLVNLNSIIISRTGYTGEDGFEIFAPPQMIMSLWNRSLDLGGIPCGLATRDLLRLEAGYCLYGNELDENRDPITAGLERFVRFDGRKFTGSEKLKKIISDGLKEKLVWFRIQEKVIPRKGDEIRYQGRRIGTVTSGNYSPHFGSGIGMGYVEYNLASAGNSIEIVIRNRSRIGIISRPGYTP